MQHDQVAAEAPPPEIAPAETQLTERFAAVRIPREFTPSGDVPRFSTVVLPPLLLTWPGLTRERLEATIRGINALVESMELVSWASVLDTALAIATCGLKACCMTTHATRTAERLTEFVHAENAAVYHPLHLHLVSPMATGYMFLEVCYDKQWLESHHAAPELSPNAAPALRAGDSAVGAALLELPFANESLRSSNASLVSCPADASRGMRGSHASRVSDSSMQIDHAPVNVLGGGSIATNGGDSPGTMPGFSQGQPDSNPWALAAFARASLNASRSVEVDLAPAQSMDMMALSSSSMHLCD